MTKNNTKTTLKNRILSGLLAVMMIAGIFGTWPITIFSEEPAAQNDAVYVSVASLGYASNQEALDAGEVLYIDALAVWGADSSYVDKNGNPCPQWLAYNDETVYTGMYNGIEDPCSGAGIWEILMNSGYAPYLEPGKEYSSWIAVCVGNNANVPNIPNKPNNPDADLWDGTVANSFGGGDGSEQNPYLIYTGAQLAYLASQTNNGIAYSGCYFKLMNDIDLNNINWTPIGVSGARIFSGNFDGNFFTIYNISIIYYMCIRNVTFR